MEMRCRSPPESLAPFSPMGRVVALWAAADKLVAVGGFGGGKHFLVVGPVFAETDVLHHRVVEQNHVLKNHGVIAQQHFRVHRGDIHAAHLNRTSGDVPQSGGKPGAGTLAGAGGADQRRDFALLWR